MTPKGVEARKGEAKTWPITAHSMPLERRCENGRSRAVTNSGHDSSAFGPFSSPVIRINSVRPISRQGHSLQAPGHVRRTVDLSAFS